ncbi:MAG TPA: alpha/beta hydrolase [Acidobacteriaceae bacterium]|jgi:pimeloyl-ACP methyl ester carboxylesterase
MRAFKEAARLAGLFTIVLLCGANLYAAEPTVTAHDASAGGIRLHYLQAGNGPALILLHGYTQTSRMWRPVMPVFAQKFNVIAPDLPGIGDSQIPATVSMKSAAESIHALVQSLGIKKARVVGHDIGLMVAYAYAAEFPEETEKLVLMDAFLPGVGTWADYYNDPRNWHFRFNGPTPEALVQGRERTYFEHFWNDFAADKNHSIPEADREAYTRAYAGPGRMRAGWAYFVSFLQTADDFSKLSRTKLKMPLLVIAGEKASAATLNAQGPMVASNVKVIALKNTGHWVLEEDHAETMAALQAFL